jgi:hypothetical protein
MQFIHVARSRQVCIYWLEVTDLTISHSLSLGNEQIFIDSKNTVAISSSTRHSFSLGRSQLNAQLPLCS